MKGNGKNGKGKTSSRAEKQEHVARLLAAEECSDTAVAVSTH